MPKLNDTKPITQKILVETLGEFTEKVIFPGVEAIVEKRIQPVEKRIDKIELRMGGLDKRMDGLDTRMDGMEKQMKIDKNEILNSNDKLMGELQKLNTEVAAHTKSYHDLDERIVYLEKMNALILKKLQLSA
ncbi:hypothetical protein GYA13_00015 [Candidatus Kuenenbacteria bacterium]|nr:hypothetical protein [Candidatus Kuenenbacteria bacterium]